MLLIAPPDVAPGQRWAPKQPTGLFCTLPGKTARWVGRRAVRRGPGIRHLWDLAPGDGALSWSGPTLPAGAKWRVFVDDDEHLGDGEPSSNHPDLTEPMRVQDVAQPSASVSGLIDAASHVHGSVLLMRN